MSLIHDALKKAQREAHEEVEKGERPAGFGAEQTHSGLPSRRTVILLAAFLFSMGYFVYSKWLVPTPSKTSPHASSGKAVPLTPQPGEDGKKLKALALEAYRENDLDTAWGKFVAATSVAPDDAEVWNNLGVVQKKRGDTKKAREAYDKALELKKDYPEALNNSAVLDLETKNYAAAKAALDQALVLQPNYAEALFHRAVVAEQLGDISEAVEFYKKFLKFGKALSPHVLDEVREHILDIDQ